LRTYILLTGFYSKKSGNKQNQKFNINEVIIHISIMQLLIYVKFKRNAKVRIKIIIKNNFYTKNVNTKK